jgi:hypothetical protein
VRGICFTSGLHAGDLPSFLFRGWFAQDAEIPGDDEEERVGEEDSSKRRRGEDDPEDASPGEAETSEEESQI